MVCAVNFTGRPVAPPPHHALLLASAPLDGDGLLPPDTAVWLRV